MPRSTNLSVATMGIDIGKNSFHVVGLDQRGAIVVRQRWTRSQIRVRLANMPPCLIASVPITSAAGCIRLATTHGSCQAVLHRVRERLVSQRTGIINQIRAFLLESGIAVRSGPASRGPRQTHRRSAGRDEETAPGANKGTVQREGEPSIT